MGRQLSLYVVGVDFLNKKGPTRRFEIEMCSPGEPIELRPEPKNPADPNAVAVYSMRDIQIGYITAERAPFIKQQMGRGEVTAIFQSSNPTGCAIRVGLDGEMPTLPEPTDSRANDWPPPMSEDPDWWPDQEWPE